LVPLSPRLGGGVFVLRHKDADLNNSPRPLTANTHPCHRLLHKKTATTGSHCWHDSWINCMGGNSH
ncbi:unnamed protein product, partial [Staurois parvus]